jgi:O-6-methylguanine DNA methyltransferase
MTITFTSMESPVGRLWIATTESGVCRIGLPNEDRGAFLSWLERRVDALPPREDATVLAPVVAQLEAYFARQRKAFDLPLDLQGSAFQRSVWAEMAKIPYGTTVSYGQIAQRLGRGPGAARAVGAAGGANPVPIIVPCHRVLGADGSLVGYGGGLDMKVSLLQLEGVLL